jgi:hypothetical protein
VVWSFFKLLKYDGLVFFNGTTSKYSPLAAFQVSALVAQLFQMRARMKNLAAMMQGGSIPGMEGLEEGLKGGRKVSQYIVTYCMMKVLQERLQRRSFHK